MPAPHTLSAGSVNLVLFAAQQRGADPAVLCRAAGIDPALLRDPDGRVPIRQMQVVWREAVKATGDPALSLRLGELVNPAAVGVLAYVMMHCPTLGHALAKLYSGRMKPERRADSGKMIRWRGSKAGCRSSWFVSFEQYDTKVGGGGGAGVAVLRSRMFRLRKSSVPA